MADTPEVAGRRARARRTAVVFGIVAVVIFVGFIVARSMA
jgi:hypothetical protein